MPAYGYLAYLVRVTPRARTRDLQRLNDIGHTSADLFSEIRAELAGLGDAYYSNANRAEGFRVNSVEPHGRSVFMRIRRGPEGNPGETYDLDSQTSTETNERTALLSELRAAIYIPENSYFGFLFVERVGGRHLKDLFYTRTLVPVAKRLNQLIRIEAFAELEDWRIELAPQQVLRVTEVLKRTDSAADASTVDDMTVKITAEGPPLRQMSDSIKERVLDILNRRNHKYRLLADIAPYENRRRIWGQIQGKDGSTRDGYEKSPKSFFTVADQGELEALKVQLEVLEATPETADLLGQLQAVLPVDRTQLESQRLEVALGDQQPEKTFVVEGDSVPQLVYPLGGRLLDIGLQQTWNAQAEKFLTNLGVSYSAGWLLEV